MQVNQVSNVSFSGKKANIQKKHDRNEYYRWVSQNQANEVLKMSVGREEEDGKYKAASAITRFTGIVGAIVSGKALIANAVKSKEQIVKAPEKLAKHSKTAQAALVLSAGALFASLQLDCINRYKADKTAAERGFYTDKDRRKMNDKDEIHALTDLVYNSHIKQ